MRARRTAVALGVTLALALMGPLAASPPGSRAPGSSSSFESTEPTSPECLEAAPDQGALGALQTDTGQQVRLDVRVLLDGISGERGQQVMGLLSRTFGALNIVVNPSFESVGFSGADASGLLQQAKNHVGGSRPAGIDVVHVLTNKNLVDTVPGAPPGAESPAPAGAADCIGGIRLADRAFSLSEAYGAENFSLGPVTAYYWAEAKIAAHEIAHLLGGQHHFSNCVEGIPTELDGPEVSPCTLMFPTVDLASFNLDAVNAKLVRGYALRYAAP